MDAFGTAEVAHPKRRQVAQIAKAALRGEGHDFELIFKEVRAGSNFEGATEIFLVPDDDQGSVELLIAYDDAEMGEAVAEDLAGALPPVGQNAEASL